MDCLSDEFELRKEATRFCKEQSVGIQAALWAALRNPKHRMKHWLQLVAIPNAPSSSSSQEMQALKKRISDLEKARSRSPRRNAQGQNAIAGAPLLALPPPLAPAQGSKGGKGSNFRRREKGNGKTGSSSPQQSNGSQQFEQIMKLPVEFRNNFHERFHNKEISYALEKKKAVPAEV